MKRNAWEKAQAIKNKLIDQRRDFHMHPELGFSEVRTSGIVARILQELGYQVKTRDW